MIKVTLGYKSGQRFDLEYYLGHHIPMSEKALRVTGIVRSEIVRALPGPDGSPGPFQVMTNIYYERLEDFQAMMQHPVMAELFADIANFYDGGEPVIMVGEVVYQG